MTADTFSQTNKHIVNS